MQCPKCDDVELTAETSAGVEIDRCPSCHGVWLDALELERLIEAHSETLFKQDRVFKAHVGEAGPPLLCPRCRGAHLIKLNSRLRPGTIIDSCTVCFGAWLDAGELARLGGDDLLVHLRGMFRADA